MSDTEFAEPERRPSTPALIDDSVVLSDEHSSHCHVAK